MDGGRFRPGAAQLILSGSALAVFLCIHVKQFRFGELAVPGDIHTLARATLSLCDCGSGLVPVPTRLDLPSPETCLDLPRLA